MIVGGIGDYVVCVGFLLNERYMLSFKALKETSLTVTRMDIRLVDDLEYLVIGVVRAVKVSFADHQMFSMASHQVGESTSGIHITESDLN